MAFAGLLHDVLCKRTRALALGKRVLFSAAFKSATGDETVETSSASTSATDRRSTIFSWMITS